jgi:hypothetical protein
MLAHPAGWLDGCADSGSAADAGGSATSTCQMTRPSCGLSGSRAICSPTSRPRRIRRRIVDSDRPRIATASAIGTHRVTGADGSSDGCMPASLRCGCWLARAPGGAESGRLSRRRDDPYAGEPMCRHAALRACWGHRRAPRVGLPERSERCYGGVRTPTLSERAAHRGSRWTQGSAGPRGRPGAQGGRREQGGRHLAAAQASPVAVAAGLHRRGPSVWPVAIAPPPDHPAYYEERAGRLLHRPVLLARRGMRALVIRLTGTITTSWWSPKNEAGR